MNLPTENTFHTCTIIDYTPFLGSGIKVAFVLISSVKMIEKSFFDKLRFESMD